MPLDESRAAFPFANTGDVGVTVASVTTSSGCTTAALEMTTYAPGKSGEIRAAASDSGVRQATPDGREGNGRSEAAARRLEQAGRDRKMFGMASAGRPAAGGSLTSWAAGASDGRG